MFQVKAEILSNTQIAPRCFHMSLKAPSIAKQAVPGQFIQVRCNGDNFIPLLRRPFSIHRVSHSSTAKVVEILYKVVGKGTEFLSKKEPGTELDIIGPLGNGFSLVVGRDNIILIGGGIGIAPLLFLAERLIAAQSKRKVLVLLGAKNKRQILCAEDFKKLGAEVRIATEDGSEGFEGTVIALLGGLVSSLKSRVASIYASGPKPMLKEIAHISQEKGITCELSWEEIIGCGFGACLGCTVATREGYKLVCKDGPVFNRTQLLWE
jgi:dihydroorotate dehydrogenase electron transfer subunit